MRSTGWFTVPGLLALLLAGSARAGGGGRIARHDHPAPARVVVEGGWFAMGVPPSDIPVLVDECAQVSNEQVYLTIPTAPGVLGPPAIELELCSHWGELLGRRGPREVWVDGFTIDRTEVRQDAYRACVHAGACSAVPLTGIDAVHLGDALPVVWITRDEAAGYCAWRGGRLPTEAEWEKAARGTDGRTWPWGDHARPADLNHGKPRDAVLREADRLYGNARGRRLLGDPDDSDGHRYAAPVGALRWGRGPYGTVDQAGNVAEWIADDWSDQGYDGLSRANPVRRVGGNASAMTRGGSWRDPRFLARTDVPPYASAMAPFAELTPDLRALHIGLRCVYGGAAPDDQSVGGPSR